MDQNINEQEPGVSPRQAVDDEINLGDLCLILIKRKFLVLGFFIVSLCLGSMIAFLPPAKYSYLTTVEIGSFPVDNNETGGITRELIESPEMVLAKIKQSHIPLAQYQISRENNGRILGVAASIPKSSDLISLVSKGEEVNIELYKELHASVVASLLAGHQSDVEVLRTEHRIKLDSATKMLNNLEDPRVYAIAEKALKLKLNAARMSLVEYDDQEKLYLSKKLQLAETQFLLKKQIKKIEESLDLAYASQPKALSEAADETRAMTLLLINNQIQQSDNRLASLQERLTVGVESQKQQAEKDIADNKRAKELKVAMIDELQSQLVNLRVQRESQQAEQKNVIALLENSFSKIRETKVLGLAVKSLKPVGPGRSVLMALSGFFGVLGGVILAFFVEFISNARRRMQSEVAPTE